MDKLLIIGIPVAIILLIALYLISVYNRLVGSREFVRNSMGNIAAAVESRWDALTNLISATKQYSEHEASVLRDVTAQRTGVSKTSSPQEVENDDRLFQQAMTRLNVVAESYPDLKADQVYQNTMNSVNQYENNVRQSRMIYNDTVTQYNRTIKSFPSNLIAGLFGFRQEEYFQHTQEKSSMPTW